MKLVPLDKIERKWIKAVRGNWSSLSEGGHQYSRTREYYLFMKEVMLT
jgi:hypothetical protein